MWLGSNGKFYAPGDSVPAEVTKLTALATKVGIKNLDMGDFSDKAKGTKKE